MKKGNNDNHVSRRVCTDIVNSFPSFITLDLESLVKELVAVEAGETGVQVSAPVASDPTRNKKPRIHSKVQTKATPPPSHEEKAAVIDHIIDAGFDVALEETSGFFDDSPAPKRKRTPKKATPKREPKGDAKDDAKDDAKSEPKDDVKSEPRREPKDDAKGDVKRAPRREPKDDAKDDAKSEPRRAPRREPRRAADLKIVAEKAVANMEAKVVEERQHKTNTSTNTRRPRTHNTHNTHSRKHNSAVKNKATEAVASSQPNRKIMIQATVD